MGYVPLLLGLIDVAGTLTALLSFVVVLGLVVFLHEFGHFIVAKAFGMRVFVFSFGMGQRLTGFKWGDTDCRISLLPIGGYVRLEGEPEDDLTGETVGDRRDFLARPRWQRFLVYLAGPVMNGVLAIAILTGQYMRGFVPVVDTSKFDPPVVGAVDAGSPAAGAGVRAGDQLVAVGDTPTPNWEAAQVAILLRPGQEVALGLRGTGGERTVRVVLGTKDHVGDAGIHPLVQIGQVVPDSAAARAGLQVDDGIVRIDDRPITAFTEIRDIIRASEGKPLRFGVLRQGSLLDLTVTPVQNPEGLQVGIVSKTVIRSFPFPEAMQQAAYWTWNQVTTTTKVLWGLVSFQLSPKLLSGPPGIAREAGRAAEQGGIPGLLLFTAFISVQVGLLNLILPIPVLDAGNMAILLAEGTMRRDISLRARELLMQAGVVCVILLLGIAVYSDLSKTELLKKYLP